MVRRTRSTLAEQADRYRLYEQSVQCVEAEIDFVEETFKDLRGRPAFFLREDFCGTASVCCEWVRRHRRKRAIGVDIDPKVLSWGATHNQSALAPGARRRLSLVRSDVLKIQAEPVDCVLAMNFSYWLFKERKTMRRYFRRVHAGLVEDGIFFLDAYGGYDAFRVLRERTRHDGFTYVWDQASYNPISGEMSCHMHFNFKDGSRLPKAFSYVWRLWTLPEIREILHESGFSHVAVYWQGTDEETGAANGIFLPTEVGQPDPGWIAYIVAER